MSRPIPPTIPGSNKLENLEITNNLSLKGKLFNINDAEDNNLIAYQESSKSWIPRAISPIIIQTVIGVISNINTSTRWIRWGQNTDGTADTFLLPDGGSYIGFTMSFNDTVPISSGVDPTSIWNINIGRVYEGTEDVIDCSNTSSNFNIIDNYTFTKDIIDAGNGFPQLTNRAITVPLLSATRISANSIASGSWNFNNGDATITVYFAVNTLAYM